MELPMRQVEARRFVDDADDDGVFAWIMVQVVKSKTNPDWRYQFSCQLAMSVNRNANLSKGE